MSSYNPYQGFDTPFYPGYNESYDRCGCGAQAACGNEHKPIVAVKTISRATPGGKMETVTVTQPLGKMYAMNALKPFAVWDGHAALNDLHGPKVRQYRPPALPAVCNRPVAGSSLCGLTQGSCNP